MGLFLIVLIVVGALLIIYSLCKPGSRGGNVPGQDQNCPVETKPSSELVCLAKIIVRVIVLILLVVLGLLGTCALAVVFTRVIR